MPYLADLRCHYEAPHGPSLLSAYEDLLSAYLRGIDQAIQLVLGRFVMHKVLLILDEGVAEVFNKGVCPLFKLGTSPDVFDLNGSDLRGVGKADLVKGSRQPNR